MLPAASARVVAIGAIVQGSAAIPMMLTGGVAVQMRAELEFSSTMLGIATAVFLFARAIGSIALGWVADHLGARRSMRLAMVSAAVAMLGIAATARSWWTLIAWLAFAGGSQALAQPAVNRFLVRAVEPSRLGTVFGLKQAGPPLASLLAGLAVPALALTVGWRWAFVAGAVLAMLALLAIPRRSLSLPTSTHTGGPSAHGAGLLWIGFGNGMAFAAVSSVTTFVVVAAVESGIEPGNAGLLLTAGSVIVIVARLLAGMWADRPGSDAMLGVIVLLAIGVLGYPLFLANLRWLVVVATLVTLGAGWGHAGLTFLSVVRYNPEAPGAATGRVTASAVIGGLGPPVFGLVVDRVGFDTAWLMATSWAALAVLAMVMGRRAIVRRLEESTEIGG